MGKQCANCRAESLSFGQLAKLAIGGTTICSSCGCVLERNMLVHWLFSMALVLLTVFLFVVLGNLFGMIGIALAFIVPLLLEVTSIYWHPLSVRSVRRSAAQ
jgi:hypothetical protein